MGLRLFGGGSIQRLIMNAVILYPVHAKHAPKAPQTCASEIAGIDPKRPIAASWEIKKKKFYYYSYSIRSTPPTQKDVAPLLEPLHHLVGSGIRIWLPIPQTATNWSLSITYLTPIGLNGAHSEEL